MNSTIVSAANELQKNFRQHEVLSNFNLNIPKGNIYGLLGENGAGKTTFMKILLGLLKPSGGEAYVCGNIVTEHDKSYLSKVGSLIEIPAFYDWLTVGENLSLHCDYLKKNYDNTTNTEYCGHSWNRK